MENILLIAIVGTLNVVCFFIGAKVGNAVSRGKEVEMPTVNPIKIYRDAEEKKAVDKEREKLETVLRNIDRYDGTGLGQEDIPR